MSKWSPGAQLYARSRPTEFPSASAYLALEIVSFMASSENSSFFAGGFRKIPGREGKRLGVRTSSHIAGRTVSRKLNLQPNTRQNNNKVQLSRESQDDDV